MPTAQSTPVYKEREKESRNDTRQAMTNGRVGREQYCPGQAAFNTHRPHCRPLISLPSVFSSYTPSLLGYITTQVHTYCYKSPALLRVREKQWVKRCFFSRPGTKIIASPRMMEVDDGLLIMLATMIIGRTRKRG